MNNWTLTQSTVGDHVFLENSYPGHYTCLNLTTGELYALADFLLPYAQRPILPSELDHEPRRNCPEDMQWSDRLGCVSIPED